MTFQDRLAEVLVTLGSAVMASTHGADVSSAIGFGASFGRSVGRALGGEDVQAAEEQAPRLHLVKGSAHDPSAGIAGAAMGAAVEEEAEDEPERFASFFEARHIAQNVFGSDPNF